MATENQEKKYSETPLMKQYYEIKAKYPEALLLFRIGDFYETFGEDAIFTSNALNIVLTKRANGHNTFIELAGFPYHALDNYLYKLVQAGAKVAICEQLEDPKTTKKIVKRGVTELITPGIALNDKLLEVGKNNFLAAIHFTVPKKYAHSPLADQLMNLHSGISFLDLSTGEFFFAEGNGVYVKQLLDSFLPSEVIVERNKRSDFIALFGNDFYISCFEDWVFKPDFAQDILLNHFHTTSLKGFGIHDISDGVVAAAACMHYVYETKHENLQHINTLKKINESSYVWMDRFTIRNLDIFDYSDFPSKDRRYRSLYQVLNKTYTPMGSRLLIRYLSFPLVDLKEIGYRQKIVGYFIEHKDILEALSEVFCGIGDVERLLSKVASNRVHPRELLKMGYILRSVEKIKQLAARNNMDNFILQDSMDRLSECTELRDTILSSIDEESAGSVAKGKVICDGVNAELDELRELSLSGKSYLAKIQQEEIEKTGISSLKLGYNNVFGYYLEVTNAHKDKVPETWIRKQTLTTGERYITEELKTYEQRILTAQERIQEIQQQIYDQLVEKTKTYIQQLQSTAQALAFIDVMMSFAHVAEDYHYCCPCIDESFDIEISKGRHPVIERNMKAGDSYIPNDLFLNRENQQIMMITGPNMSGKSAVLRQTALIVLMAQIGSYVPAESARIGVIDKIFTRVGASDNLSYGESTFMVEMNETANILNNISDRSLILLDEIGRGTSTYDGISIARSIAEYLHDNGRYYPKVLFATHYHELNEMEEEFPRIKNYHVSVKQIDHQIIFLRTLCKGGSAHSFGIHVAEMAGMPRWVTQRAEEILKQLEISRSEQNIPVPMASRAKKMDSPEVEKAEKEGIQLSFIQLDDPLLEQIKYDILGMDLNNLTPIEALNKLNSIKRLLDKKNH